MAGTRWDRTTLAALEHSVVNGLLTDFAGYSSLNELYRSVEMMGDSPDVEIRGHVESILYWLDRERAFSYLTRRLGDPDDDIRRFAVELMGWYGERITPWLIPILQADSSADVRCCAAAMLGYFGAPDALSALRRAAESDHMTDFHGNRVSSVAKDAIKDIKARYREGSTYNPWDVRSLIEERQVDHQENPD